MKKIILAAIVMISFASCQTIHTYTMVGEFSHQMYVFQDFEQFQPGQRVNEGRAYYIVVSEIK